MSRSKPFRFERLPRTHAPLRLPNLADIALVGDVGFDMSDRDVVGGFTPLLTSSTRAAKGVLANPSRARKGGFEGSSKDSGPDVDMSEGEVTRQEIRGVRAIKQSLCIFIFKK